MPKRRVIDISPLISEKSAVFPGDTAFSREGLLHFDHGHNLVLSTIRTTVHIGAHADAPIHYHAQGDSIENRDLDLYLGPCQVIRVQIPRGARIQVPDLKGAEISEERVLFRTDSFPDPDRWSADFNSLSAPLVDFLHSKGVKLVGIDTPSVDLADDKVLESHQAIYRNDMAVLEGIVLSAVEPGKYELIALPLKIKGGDASPVRAVLIS